EEPGDLELAGGLDRRDEIVARPGAEEEIGGPADLEGRVRREGHIACGPVFSEPAREFVQGQILVPRHLRRVMEYVQVGRRFGRPIRGGPYPGRAIVVPRSGPA